MRVRLRPVAQQRHADRTCMKILLLMLSAQPAETLLAKLGSLPSCSELSSQSIASMAQLLTERSRMGTSDVTVIWAGPGSPAEREILTQVCRDRELPPVLVFSPGLKPSDAIGYIEAGALDAVDWPCSDERLQLAFDKLHKHTEQACLKSSAVRLSVLPGKGGSGGSFVAVNLAYALATQFQKRTLLIDMDMAFGDATFGLTEARHSLNCATAAMQEQPDPAFALSACFQVHERLWLLQSPCSLEVASQVAPPKLGQLIDLLTPQFDVIIMDLDRRLDACTIEALDRSDQVIQVMLPLIPDLRDAELQRKNLLELGVREEALALVVNRSGAFGPTEEKVIEKLTPAPLICLSYEPEAAVHSANSGESVLLLSPASVLARQFIELAGRVTHQETRKTTWVDRAKDFIFHT